MVFERILIHRSSMAWFCIFFNFWYRITEKLDFTNKSIIINVGNVTHSYTHTLDTPINTAKMFKIVSIRVCVCVQSESCNQPKKICPLSGEFCTHTHTFVDTGTSTNTNIRSYPVQSIWIIWLNCKINKRKNKEVSHDSFSTEVANISFFLLQD